MRPAWFEKEMLDSIQARLFNDGTSPTSPSWKLALACTSRSGQLPSPTR
jgi:hypothetical protein